MAQKTFIDVSWAILFFPPPCHLLVISPIVVSLSLSSPVLPHFLVVILLSHHSLSVVILTPVCVNSRHSCIALLPSSFGIVCRLVFPPSSARSRGKIELISKKKHKEIRTKNLPGAQMTFNRRLGRISALSSLSFSTVAFKTACLECSQH